MFSFLCFSQLSADVPHHVQDSQVSGFNIQRSLTVQPCHVKVKVVYTLFSLRGKEKGYSSAVWKQALIFSIHYRQITFSTNWSNVYCSAVFFLALSCIFAFILSCGDIKAPEHEEKIFTTNQTFLNIVQLQNVFIMNKSWLSIGMTSLTTLLQ